MLRLTTMIAIWHRTQSIHFLICDHANFVRCQKDVYRKVLKRHRSLYHRVVNMSNKCQHRLLPVLSKCSLSISIYKLFHAWKQRDNIRQQQATTGNNIPPVQLFLFLFLSLLSSASWRVIILASYTGIRTELQSS